MERLLQIMTDALPILLKGAAITVQVSLASVIIGLVCGTLLGIINCDRLKLPVLSQIVATFVNIIRGTPIFVQLLFVYFALPDLIGFEFTPLAAGIFTLGLNSTAYLSETLRGGINGVPDGQWEACYVLGYTRPQTLRSVVLPQALKSVLPAITNEFATLIKDSSILMVIGVPELIKNSKDIVARELNPIPIYLLAALLYLVMTSVISAGALTVERKIR